MIHWHYGREIVRAGDAGEHLCGRCGHHSPHSIMISYAYFTLFVAFGISSCYTYYVVCDRCDAGKTIGKAGAKAICTHLSIPFMRRFGLLLLLAIFGAAFGIGFLAEKLGQF